LASFAAEWKAMSDEEKQGWQEYQAEIVDATSGAYQSGGRSATPTRSHHKPGQY
jgi:hypothetical protein